MQPPSPSSSTTTPSPSLSFLHPPGRTVPDDVHAHSDLDPQEREERQRAVKKLLARAEFSKLTRGLRARLAYASFKATHNLERVPLPVLEHRLRPPSPSSPSKPPPPPTSPYQPKRHAPDAMPPPAAPAPSLYSSLLSPPPSKRPRHAYAPADATPPRRKQPPPPPSPARFPHGRTVHSVLQGRARSNVTEKEDMNAAATLTALMFKGASPRAAAGARPDANAGMLAPPPRTTTPTPASTPKATEDADAAELMLFLATSPSPFRPPSVKRTPGSAAAVGMGRVLFPAARDDGAGAAVEREQTPGLTASQGSLASSSQDTAASAAGPLLPPPPSPSTSPQKKYDLDVSRRLFDDAPSAGGGGGGGSVSVSFGALGKGIDLVEAK